MSRIVFFSTPAHGHVNPTLPLVAELVRRGHEVVYFSIDAFREAVTATGSTYREYKDLAGIDTVALGRNLAELYYGIINYLKIMVPNLIKEIDEIHPDCIMHDSIAVWGRYIAEMRRMPAISSITTFAYNERTSNLFNTLRFIHQVKWDGIRKMKRAMTIQRGLFAEYGIQPRRFIQSMMNEEPLTLVYTSRLFQPRSELYDAGRYKFVGPILADRKNDPDATDYSALRRPLVYVSMGTVWKDFYDMNVIIDALDGMYGTLVFSGAGEASSRRSRNDILVKSHVNQLEVLRNCDLFITHGGMNSVTEGLYFNVPLCVYPFQSEQNEVAERVCETGCGVRIARMDKAHIRKAAIKVMNNGAYRSNCERMANSFRSAGGCIGAADLIEEYLHRSLKA